MARAAGDYAGAGRRRSARHATAADEIKNEAVGVSDENRKKLSKTGATATTTIAERGLATDSLSSSAMKPRRNKRVKVDEEGPGYRGNDEVGRGGGKAESPGRKRIKLEDEELSAASSPLSSPPSMRAKSETDSTDDEDYGDDDDDDYGNGKSARRAAPKKGKAGSKTKPSTSAVDATAATAGDLLQTKKLKSYAQFAAARQSPYPDFPHPTAAEAKLAHRILASLHGERVRPTTIVAPTSRSGCGDSPNVLDALIRTILSQNTSDANSSRAKLAIDRVYGSATTSSSPNPSSPSSSSADAVYAAIVAGGQEKLAKTIESGGLAVVKSKVIISLLQQTHEKYGRYSLDHLFCCSDEDAMREMISFKGVGPKTASCVLLFCLRRENFAVDTHVHRISGLLGWRPVGASRDQTHAHLDARIPDEDKYGLHVLLVRHGKECAECRAGGKSVGKCELRKAFRRGKAGVKGEGEGKGEEVVKDEDGEEGEEDDVKV